MERIFPQSFTFSQSYLTLKVSRYKRTGDDEQHQDT